ncbi:hypothetical protein JHK82_022758 [Glycine max]|nr:hypothetical protein JHK87_022673 [Glycine soja]KAG5138027.1 hypothetical protein JHK82_022758 [Glycine max]
MSGPDQRSIPGNTIVVDAHMPFGGLATFGGSFLSKFQCSQMPHPLYHLMELKALKPLLSIHHIVNEISPLNFFKDNRHARRLFFLHLC